MTKPALYEILYVSTLAPEAPLKVVADIAGAARSRNAAQDITGLLVFDGQRFCQQLEGRQKEVLALLESIRKDARHTDLQVLHHGPLASRRFRSFSLAYAPVEDIELLEQLESLDGEAALEKFVGLIQNLDMQE